MIDLLYTFFIKFKIIFLTILPSFSNMSKWVNFRFFNLELWPYHVDQQYVPYTKVNWKICKLTKILLWNNTKWGLFNRVLLTVNTLLPSVLQCLGSIDQEQIWCRFTLIYEICTNLCLFFQWFSSLQQLGKEKVATFLNGTEDKASSKGTQIVNNVINAWNRWRMIGKGEIALNMEEKSYKMR